jgi:hypothetical protein
MHLFGVVCCQYLAGGTSLAETNVELVVEQGLVVGANINGDGQALQGNQFVISTTTTHSRFFPLFSLLLHSCGKERSFHYIL